MKTIGLLGGMSWESTATYYKLINEYIREAKGPIWSAKIVLLSVNFKEIETLQHHEKWDDAGALLATYAKQIEAAGADFLVICTNTMHKVSDNIEAGLNIPLLHIADATAGAIKKRKMKKVGLLGTQFTMEQAFYRDRLIKRHGLEVLTPDGDDKKTIHSIIYDELCNGIVSSQSKKSYIAIAETLVQRGAQGIVAGCTEIGLLLKPNDIDVPLFDTAEIHALAAAKLAIPDNEL